MNLNQLHPQFTAKTVVNENQCQKVIKKLAMSGLALTFK